MPFAWASLALSAVGTAESLSSDGPSGTSSQSPAGAADPFAAQRPAYQDKLSTFMWAPPPSILTGGPGASNFHPTDPSYQFRMSQGLEAVNRNQAAGGMLHSGNRLAALEQYGQGLASTEYGAEYARTAGTYDQQYQRLAQLSGATIGSPGTAGQLQANQNASASAGWQGLAGKAVNTVKDWYNGSGNFGDTGGDSGSGNGSGSFGNGSDLSWA